VTSYWSGWLVTERATRPALRSVEIQHRLSGSRVGPANARGIALAARAERSGRLTDALANVPLVIKYIGSKRTLVPLIEQVAARLPVSTACDLFAGTTRAGQGLRRVGIEVLSNDTATYSEALGHAYIASGHRERQDVAPVLAELARLPGDAAYFTRTFCVNSRYFQPHNGARIDAIRSAIDDYCLDPVSRGLVLTSLIEAADRVDSTCGLQMAYLKHWAQRSHNDLELRLPALVSGPHGTVVRSDANQLARSLDVDLVYIDPPYNQHSYFSNYHVWETLIRWDDPETYGIAMKRLDCRTNKSDYNFKRRASAAFDDLLDRLDVPWMVVSFNNEGFHEPAHVLERLREHGYVNHIEIDFRRYVGAQIGIYNPRGDKVGAVSHLRNKEALFVVGPDRAQVEAIFDGLVLRADETARASRSREREAALLQAALF
jgi:adenine-specific DNA-methyltransferase